MCAVFLEPTVKSGRPRLDPYAVDKDGYGGISIVASAIKFGGTVGVYLFTVETPLITLITPSLSSATTSFLPKYEE